MAEKAEGKAYTRVYGRGRTQIPSILRRWLSLRDGDILVWEVSDGEVKVFKGAIERVTATHFSRGRSHNEQTISSKA